MKKYILLFGLVVCLVANTKISGLSGRPFETARHNINNIEMVITNYGTFGQHENGSDQGLWWPKGTGRDYIFGAGSWFGTIINGDSLVTIGYGPSGGQHEFAPGRIGWSVGDPDGIIFLYPETWPSVPPDRLADVFPPKTLSHQDSWCVYNDGDIQYHMAGDTRPIGLEVYQTVYAWNLSTTADIIFIKFEVRNVTGELSEYYPNGPVTLSDCWFGVCTDNDVGNEAGELANDVCSCIIEQIYILDSDTLLVNDLGYQWQWDDEPGWDPPYPGVIGFDYLQSPYDLVEGVDKDGDGILDQYERDSAYFWNNVPQSQWDVDLDGTPDWRDPSQIPQMGLKSFKRFTLDLEPGRDAERYMTMAGYNFVTGQYEPYDTVFPDPDDQRFVQCSGPFALEPDSSVTVLVGIVLANWRTPDGGYIYHMPDSALARVDNTAQFIYDMNWLLPGPPPPPALTCIPGDARVTLIWESVADPTSTAFDLVLGADPYYDVVHFATDPNLQDTFYLQYDFEGYGVWKSLNGQEWELLQRNDLYNDIVFDDPETGIYATNTGITHYFVDDDVRNGFTYYYAVTAYDWNRVKETDSTWRPVWFEGGKVGVSVVPRRDPADYVPGSYTSVALSGNPILATSNVNAAITYPLQMTVDPFYLDFGPIVYDDGNPQYSVVLFDADDDSLSGVSVTLVEGDETFFDFGTRNGLSISAIFNRPEIPANISIFDRIEVTGAYPDSLVAPVVFPTNWAYRGSNYEVHWISAYGSTEANSAIVIDVYAGDTLPYQAYLENTATLPLAQGWCFRALTGSTDTLVYGSIPTGTRNMYICGGKFALKVGSYLGSAPDDPRPDVGDVWYVYGRTTYPPAPANAYIEITPTPAGLVTEIDKLNVKVVPNPYIIANEWQQNFIERRMRFINLPAECTVRIFNLNGELVRSIVHHVTSGEEGAVLGDQGGDEWWDLLSDNRQLVASGVYIFHIESDVGEQVGKFVIIR